MRLPLATLLILALPLAAWAHSGRTNAEGCHNDNKNGGYHCHNKKTETKSATKTTAKTAARKKAKTDYDCEHFKTQKEAQKFYERNGGPLIDPHDLDRDEDGIACESLK